MLSLDFKGKLKQGICNKTACISVSKCSGVRWKEQNGESLLVLKWRIPCDSCKSLQISRTTSVTLTEEVLQSWWPVLGIVLNKTQSSFHFGNSCIPEKVRGVFKLARTKKYTLWVYVRKQS